MRNRCSTFAFRSFLLVAVVAVVPACGGGGGTTVEASSWGLANLIETDDIGDAQDPQVAIDPSGNAIAVWRQYDGTRWNIWSNRYVVGMGWGTAILVETDNVGNAVGPQVAVDPNGNAIAVWKQSDGTRDNLWANRYVVGPGWGTPMLIETNSVADAVVPQVAVDLNGNATVVWAQYDGVRISIWSNRYVKGAGWGTALRIETVDRDAGDPQVAFDPSGNAIAVWYQSDGTRLNIWSNRYVAGVGWGMAEQIETDDVGDAWSPKVAVDPSGNATAVWHQGDGTRYNIWSNRYVVDTGWGTALLIEINDTGISAYSPQVTVDSSGNATAVWDQHDGTRPNIWSNRYAGGVGWGTPLLIESNDAGGASRARVAVDSSGNVIAVWHQSDGTRFNIWSNRYVPGVGWGTGLLLESNDAGDASDPQVAVDPSGKAIAVWQQYDGTRWDIWSNRYE